MKIPLVDVAAQYSALRHEIEPIVLKVLESGNYILGEELENFEKEFAQFCETRFAVGVNSGTSALHLSLLAAGVGPGDEVITVPFTFVASVASILYTGARPVFVDINPDTCLMDVNQVEQKISSKTKAIIPVHLYGHPVDLRPLLTFAEKKNIVVIEDAAQAHGAIYEGCKVGSMGSLGCFSFYPSKNLGAAGEGGAITTNDETLYRKLRKLRNWGSEDRYHHEFVAYNNRLENIQAAILRIKLRHLKDWNIQRAQIAAEYDSAFQKANVRLLPKSEKSQPVHHIYPIFSKNRNVLKSKLAEYGISTGIHYPVPIHQQDGYRFLNYKAGEFPGSELAAAETLSIPIYPELTSEKRNYVIESVLNSLNG
jgi:dTDP-4-amino-4,6-dideoxygalactose transaminase